MSTSIIINTTDTEYGDKKQKSVSYIDPQASSQALITFAQGMVSLMADTSYESTTRVDRTECDVVKTARTISSVISISGSTVTLEGGVYKIQIPQNAVTGNPKSITVNVDSPQFNPFPIYTPRLTDVQITGGFNFYSWRMEMRSTPRVTCYFTQANAPEVGETIKSTIIVPEDENFAELAIKFEVTITAGGE